MATRDEEDIAMAMLLGGNFILSANSSFKLWYIDADNSPPHPIEEDNRVATGYCGFKSRPDLARAFIKFTLERLNGTEDGASD